MGLFMKECGFFCDEGGIGMADRGVGVGGGDRLS